LAKIVACTGARQMPKYPLTTVTPKRNTSLREIDADAVVPASPPAKGSGFLSFRYSSTVVSSQGGRTQVKAKRVSLEDGKLSSESFEGELDGRAHDDAVRRAQQQVLEDADAALDAAVSLSVERPRPRPTCPGCRTSRSGSRRSRGCRRR
jgi:hypothetical protein